MGDSWAELGLALVHTDKHLLGSLMLFFGAAGVMALFGYRMHLDDKRKAAQEAINLEYAKCGNDRRHNTVSAEDLVALEGRVMKALGGHDKENKKDFKEMREENAANLKATEDKLAADLKSLSEEGRKQGENIAQILGTLKARA